MSRVSLSAIDAPFRSSFSNLLDSEPYRQSTSSVPAMVHQNDFQRTADHTSGQGRLLMPERCTPVLDGRLDSRQPTPVHEYANERLSYGRHHLMDTHTHAVELPVSLKPTQVCCTRFRKDHVHHLVNYTSFGVGVRARVRIDHYNLFTTLMTAIFVEFFENVSLLQIDKRLLLCTV